MKRFLTIFGAVVLAGGGAIAILAARYEVKIRPSTFIGNVPVGDLTRDEAMRRLRIWWENEKLRPLNLVVPNSSSDPMPTTIGKMGYVIDDVSSIQSLPIDSFWDSAGRVLGRDPIERKAFELKLKSNGADTKWVQEFVRKQVGTLRPATVKFENGTIIRDYEVSGYALDHEALLPRMLSAFQTDGMLELPVKMGDKKIPDTELDKIKEVVSEFSTRFPAGQRNRNENLKLASGKLDGLILMPGESFSFNQIVGQRTMDDGYKIAPVLKNGRHDVGIGGGICQVSGTLYNAVVYANLKVLLRSNHSLPSAYLALGRDCTVSWPSLDFKFQNDTDLPIAISRTYEPGKLTFRILGTKNSGQEVKLQTVGHRSWGRGLKYEHDGSLPFGKQKVIEKGSAGHAVTVYRIVLLNGTEVKREVLNRSNYGGSPRIIALNKMAKPPTGTVSPVLPGGTEPDPVEPPD